MAQLRKEIIQTVRPTEIKPWLTTETMSPLGRELNKLADEIAKSDADEMSEEDIERELTERRGGYSRNGE